MNLNPNRRRRRPWGMALRHDELERAKTYRETRPAICGECFERIDLVAVQAAIDTDRGYVHGCWRRLL